MLAILAAAGPAEPPPPRYLPARLVRVEDGAPAVLAPGAPLLHIVFFATWCPPCRAELPRLRELELRWGEAGYRLAIVAVATRQSLERLRQFARDAQPPGELWFDSGGALARSLRVEWLPSHLLVGPEGRVLLSADALDARVEQTIRERMREVWRGEARP